MFHRSVRVFTPKCVQTRGMATLKDIRLRLKSITNIQKITKSMKMVSAAKFARAERELRVARPYGQGASAFFEKVEAKRDETQPNHIVIAVTSDRGLCGAVHSSVVKAVKAAIAGKKDGIETKLVLIGDKARTMLRKLYADQILLTVQEIGKKAPTFQDASRIAEYVMASDYKFNYGSLFYNVFRSVVSYRTKEMPLFSVDSISQAEKLPNYDSLDEEILQCYNEFALATLVYFALKESATSEQSSRMTAMDSASKNAGEMIDKLTLTFNRTRQAVITKELIEIISGAAAL